MRRITLLSLLLLAAAATVSAAQEKLAVRLLAPAVHAEADPGSTLLLAWENDGTLKDVEEWEAFLSVDGGRTYPIRITPHLDASIHAFPWNVPLLPGADLSILLRLGNERTEHEIAFPGHLRIRKTIPPELLARRIDAQAAQRTEVLNDHGQLLVEWIDGTRDGLALRHTVVRDTMLNAAYDFASSDPQTSPAVSRHSIESATPVTRAAVIARLERTTPRSHPQPFRSDILTLVRRLNI